MIGMQKVTKFDRRFFVLKKLWMWFDLIGDFFFVLGYADITKLPIVRPSSSIPAKRPLNGQYVSFITETVWAKCYVLEYNAALFYWATDERSETKYTAMGQWRNGIKKHDGRGWRGERGREAGEIGWWWSSGVSYFRTGRNSSPLAAYKMLTNERRFHLKNKRNNLITYWLSKWLFRIIDELKIFFFCVCIVYCLKLRIK